MFFTPLKTKTSIGFCVAASAIAHLVFLFIAHHAPASEPEAFIAGDDTRAIVQIAALSAPVMIENAALPEAWTAQGAEPAEVTATATEPVAEPLAAVTEAAVEERSSSAQRSTNHAPSVTAAPDTRPAEEPANVAPADERVAPAADLLAVAATDEGSGPVSPEQPVNAANTSTARPSTSDSMHHADATGDAAAAPAAPAEPRGQSAVASLNNAPLDNAPLDNAPLNNAPPRSDSLTGDDSHRELVARYAGRVRNVLGAPPVTAEIRAQRATGTVLVRLLVDDRGRVIGLEVVDSSGDALLDANTVAWLQDRRLPRPPRDLRGAPVAFAVPVSYFVA